MYIGLPVRSLCLLQQMTANAAVSEALANVSITIVGDDSALNQAVAAALAKKVGWFPVSTAKVLAGMNKVDNISQMTKEQGWPAVGECTAGAPQMSDSVGLPACRLGCRLPCSCKGQPVRWWPH